MPPVLRCWLTMSEADDVDMAVEVEPSQQYSITCCCHTTDDSRGAVWQNDIWHESAEERDWITPWGKKMYPLMFNKACRMFLEIKQWMWAQWGDGWCVSTVVTVTQKTSPVPDSHAEFYEGIMQALVHHWQKWLTNSSNYVEKLLSSWEFALSNSVIVLFLSVVASMERSRMINFRATYT